ncbi:type II toxin-antitoxin system VapC family toxin [Stygiolobus caldivivus]|uniref:PIN domain nuclease n=1 Tax=Stygiolobus caldivivus TaxID=2824673 RepID=A0A8D5U8F6_9CREN|nr:type II toxin-antitoxin system VapC family toxin [Stygiolobus caldivivus]BCU71268.1 PIN domain nuclease [Stygiolobus caldivivus]
MMKKVVLDTGVILSFLEGEFREYYDKILNQEVTAYVSVVNLAEVYYVLCRRLGRKKAEKIFKGLINSGYFEIFGVKPKILKYASECKCKYSISLADCFAIGTAKFLNTKALFRREKELIGINDEVEFIN